jgi:hypothetical protein
MPHLEKESIFMKNPTVYNSFHFTIKDTEKFLLDLADYVDFSVDYSDYMVNPWITESIYFGKMNWGKFTIYRQNTSLFRHWIVLKVIGEVDNSNLSFNINYFRNWILVLNTIGLTLFSILLIIHFNFYIGMAVFSITCIQSFYSFRFIKKQKNDFIKMIEYVINKNAA